MLYQDGLAAHHHRVVGQEMHQDSRLLTETGSDRGKVPCGSTERTKVYASEGSASGGLTGAETRRKEGGGLCKKITGLTGKGCRRYAAAGRGSSNRQDGRRRQRRKEQSSTAVGLAACRRKARYEVGARSSGPVRKRLGGSARCKGALVGTIASARGLGACWATKYRYMQYLPRAL
jgi:hypothetical protein